MSSADEITAAVTAARARGLRLSEARRRVIEALYTAEGPVTAEQVAAGLGGRLPPLATASVYRNLTALERAGLVERVSFAGGAAVFGVHGRRPAAVAACERCGARADIDAATLERLRVLVRAACGLREAFAHGAVSGLCPRCAQAASVRTSPS